MTLSVFLPALLPVASAWVVVGQPVIQALLIIGVLLVAFLLLRSQGAKHQAMRRILLLVFALAAIASIVFPQAWTAVANLVGVGRGTDLLLYVLIIAFLSYVATRYARDRRVERQVTLLARRIALDEASQPPGPAQGAAVPDDAAAPADGDGRPGGRAPGDHCAPGDSDAPRGEAGRSCPGGSARGEVQ